MKMLLKKLSFGLAVCLMFSSCASESAPVDNEAVASATVTTTTACERSSVATQSLQTDSQGNPVSTATQAHANEKSPAAGTEAGQQGEQPQAGGTSGNTPPAGKTTAKTTKKATTAAFSGETITIAGTKNSWFSLDASANSLNRQVREALSTIEKEKKCRFQLKQYTESDLVDACVKANKSGTKIADIINADQASLRRMAKDGALWDLNAVKDTFANKRYWTPSIHWAGKTVAIFPDLSLYNSSFKSHCVIYFNKTLAKQVGSSDAALYKMVTDGTWTFKQMQALSAKALRDLDGKGIDYEKGMDQYGFTGVDMRGGVSYAIFKAQGGYFTKISSSGAITYALGDAKNISALRTMQTWLLKDKSVFNADKNGSGGELARKIFVEGRALFLGWTLENQSRLSGAKDEWGILPYPKADVSSKYIGTGTGTVEWLGGGFGIPLTVRGARLDKVAAILETIGTRLYQINYANQSAAISNSTGIQQQVLDIVRSSVNLKDSDYLIDLEKDLGAGGLPTIRYLFDNVSNDPATRVKSVTQEATACLS